MHGNYVPDEMDSFVIIFRTLLVDPRKKGNNLVICKVMSCCFSQEKVYLCMNFIHPGYKGVARSARAVGEAGNHVFANHP
jgi:hypothetical protein